MKLEVFVDIRFGSFWLGGIRDVGGRMFLWVGGIFEGEKVEEEKVGVILVGKESGR